MKTYQYKAVDLRTLNKPINSQANSGLSSQKTYGGYQANYNETYSNSSRVYGEPIRVNNFTQNTSFTQSNNTVQNSNTMQGNPATIGPAINILEMRKKLDQIIQETEFLDAKKNSIQSKNYNTQNSIQNTSQKIPTYDSSKSQVKKIQLNTSQRYDKPEDSKIIRQKVSVKTQPHQSDSNSFNSQVRAIQNTEPKIIQSKNFSSNQLIQKYYGSNRLIDSRNQQKQTNYSVSQPKSRLDQQSKYSVSLPKSKLDDSLSFKSFNQIKRQPIIGRVDNPEKSNYESSTYENQGVKNISTSPTKIQVKRYQPTYSTNNSTNSYVGSAVNTANTGIPMVNKPYVNNYNNYKASPEPYKQISLSTSLVEKNKSQQTPRVQPNIVKTESTHRYEKTLNETSQTQRIKELQQKVRNLQAENSKLKENVKNLSESKQYYRQQFANTNKNTNKYKQQYQQKIKLLKNQNSKLMQSRIEELQKIRKENQQKIHSIEQKNFKEIEQLRNQLQKKQQKIVVMVKQLSQKQNSLHLMKKTTPIQQTDNLNKFKQSWEATKQIQINKYRNEASTKQKQIQMMNQKIAELRKQVDQLRKYKIESETEKYSNFDQILMTQLQTITELKNNMEELNQKNNQLRSENIQQSRRNDALQNQMKILELKYKSQMKNQSQQLQIQLQNKENMIGTLNKKMLTLEDRIKLAANQIKAKDQFVKQYLVSRADTKEFKQQIENILNKYQSTFPESNEQTLRIQLEKANKKLQLYEKYG